MPAKLPPTPPRARRSRDVVTAHGLGAFMTRAGRLPAFAQRRLDELIAKKKSGGGLTHKEERELAEALDYIDSKSILLLEQC